MPNTKPEIGNEQEARNWIHGSNLPTEFKSTLTKFVNNFPTLQFYRETEEILLSIEEKHQVKFPDMLRKIQTTLAFVHSDENVLIQLDTFDAWTPRIEDVNNMWYRFGLLGYSNSQERTLLHEEALFPVADCHGHECSTLAVKLSKSENLEIFEFCKDDLWDNVADGFSVFESSRQIYNSYCDIFQHIKAIMLKDSHIIQATNKEQS